MGLFDIKQDNTSTQLVRIRNGSCQIIDKELREKIKKVQLSPSMIDAIIRSPGDWVFSRYIESKVIDKQQDALIRGNWFHSTIEAFYSLPQEERSSESLVNCFKRVTKENYYELTKDERHREWAKDIINKYRTNWVTDAKNDKVATIYLQGQQKRGIELFVNGRLEGVDRNVLGFIDLLLEGKNGLIIQDWKTGSKIDNYNPNEKPSKKNNFSYWLQQTLYAMLLEQQGLIVEEARLAFPKAEGQTYVRVDFNNPTIREYCIKYCQEADRILTECITNDFTFPFKAGSNFNVWAKYFCGIGNAFELPVVDDEKLKEIVDLPEEL